MRRRHMDGTSKSSDQGPWSIVAAKRVAARGRENDER